MIPFEFELCKVSMLTNNKSTFNPNLKIEKEWKEMRKQCAQVNENQLTWVLEGNIFYFTKSYEFWVRTSNVELGVVLKFQCSFCATTTTLIIETLC
jgi:hypothetical protein